MAIDLVEEMPSIKRPGRKRKTEGVLSEYESVLREHPNEVLRIGPMEGETLASQRYRANVMRESLKRLWLGRGTIEAVTRTMDDDKVYVFTRWNTNRRRNGKTSG